MEHEEAAALLARLHAAQNQLYSGGADSAVRAMLTPDIAWHIPGNNAIAGIYRGIEKVLAYFRHRRDVAGATMQMHSREILVSPGGHVASLTDGAATIRGIEYSWSTVGLYRVIDEKIAECWLLPLDPDIFDAVWAAP